MRHFERSVLALLVFSSAMLRAGDDPHKVSFVRVIKPLLEANCIKCHGADREHGEIRLDTKAFAFGVGNNGRVIDPGKPENSTLYTTSALDDRDPLAMPPRDRDKLVPEQLSVLKRWIEEGADWPAEITLKRVEKITFSMAGSVLQRYCVKCHQDGNAAGGLRLEKKGVAFKGGGRGVPIVPYDSTASLLISSLTHQMHAGKLPKLLDQDDIMLLKQWIDQGAVWPEEMELRAKKSAAR